MQTCQIRTATPADLDAIMRVERDWPLEQRAPVEKFQARLERFPEGFLLGEVEGRVVSASTSTLANYDSADLTSFHSWEKCTNNGYLYPLTDRRDYNALFIVSNGILKEYRGREIREKIIKAFLQLAARLGMAWTVTGAMLPGYDQYCREYGEISAADYAFKQLSDGAPRDPTLRKLASLGLKLPDQDHIIKNYYSSPASRDYGALLVNQTLN
ncbi:MAG: hypothetical protein KAI63_05805 [Planctomycetes bacterium]|nr:hypothetical protein [Planctomycetota bacterium]